MLQAFILACILCGGLGQAQVELGQLRLVSSRGTSTSTSAGRLEVYYETNSQGPGWGSVCNVGFDMVDADVACRELGFLYASGYGDLVTDYGFSTYFTFAPTYIWISNLACSNTNTRIVFCSGVSPAPCDHTRDIGLTCSNQDDPLRLTSQTGETSSNLVGGRLEIFINNEWGTVCDDLFTKPDADVACRQLGFRRGAVAYDRTIDLNYPEVSSMPIWLDNLGCSFTSVDNSNLRARCSNSGTGIHNCIHSEDVILLCLDDFSVRLVSSSINATTAFTSSGRLEVFIDGRWGTVCDDGFSVTNAEVICRQLGFSGSSGWITALAGSYPSAPSGTEILLDNVDCRSTAPGLSFCSHNGVGEHNCNHNEDVAVVCGGSTSFTSSTNAPGGGGSGSGGSTINVGGIVGGVVTGTFFCMFVCIPLLFCLVSGSNRNRRPRRITVPPRTNFAVATATVTTTTVPQHSFAQDYPRASQNPPPAQQAPPPHPSTQQATPLDPYPPQATGVLQEAPPPAYEAADAYPPPAYLGKSPQTPQQPPQGQAYPPQGQTYPPQGQQAYPPQGGQAYPPQGGQAYPPQGGQAYPPQGGQAYPPQGGPAYPPQDGQAYPPQSGQAYPPQDHQQYPSPPGVYPPQPTPGPAPYFAPGAENAPSAPPPSAPPE